MTPSAAGKTGLILFVLVACISGVQAALTVEAGADQTVNVGEQVQISAIYNDTSAAEDRIATINWTLAEGPGTLVPDDDRNGTVTGTYTYTVPGTYVVTINVSTANRWTNDTLIITVRAMRMETKIVPRTLNAKSNGVMTVFLSPQDWWGGADLGRITRDALNRDMVEFLGAIPYRINFCQKDGGTFILKFRRQDLNLDSVRDNLAVSGNLTTENGKIAFEGSDSVKVIHADPSGKGNGKAVQDDQEVDNGDPDHGKGVKTNNGHGKK